MEIILIDDVPNLGDKDDIVTVKPGYANNYLFPQGLAVIATESAKKVHAENLRQRAHKEAEIKEAAKALATQLEGMEVNIKAKVSATGKIFGSVNNIQIAEALAEQGVEVDRRKITITNEETVKEVGSYEAVVKCYKEITATVKFNVIGEE